jgi:hypothetical protein
MLLAELPPITDEYIVIADNQVVKDIMQELLEAYPVFAKFYDKIGTFFEGPTLWDTCNNLYDFCVQNLRYSEESEDWQTSALPTGILTRGYCDCKGYASFIGGCLGAIERATGEVIPWQFCFASYKEKQKTPYHVFIVVHSSDGPIWVDPTPGANDMEPKHAYCRKPAETIGAIRQVVNPAGEIEFQQVGAVAGTGDPEVDNVLAVVQPVIQDLQKQFPRGTLFGNWLSDFGNLGQAMSDLGHLLFGYKYTGGDYALGEIFLNRVMGQATNNRWDVPNGVVPIAWDYFTQLLGVPINVNTDIDYLGGNDSLEGYLQGRPEQRGHVTQEQVTRAHQLIQLFGNIQDKYGQWPPTAFGVLPYAGPIPTAHGPGGLYTGVLPNGQSIVNGYPVSAATKGGDIILPGTDTGTGATDYTTYILIGAAALLLLWWVSDSD